MSHGQIDRGAEDARAFRTALFAVAFFSGVVLVNGIPAILLISLLQALGLWGASAAEAPVAVANTDELRATILAVVRRPTMLSIGA